MCWFSIVVIDIIFHFWRDTVFDFTKNILQPVMPKKLKLCKYVLEGAAHHNHSMQHFFILFFNNTVLAPARMVPQSL